MRTRLLAVASLASALVAPVAISSPALAGPKLDYGEIATVEDWKWTSRSYQEPGNIYQYTDKFAVSGWCGRIFPRDPLTGSDFIGGIWYGMRFLTKDGAGVKQWEMMRAYVDLETGDALIIRHVDRWLLLSVEDRCARILEATGI